MKLTTAALLFLSTDPARALTGCYPMYSSGGGYESGSKVSAPVDRVVSCDEDTDNECGSDGKKTVQETFNFECTSGANSAFCNNSGYKPGGVHSGIAWIKDALCDVSV